MTFDKWNFGSFSFVDKGQRYTQVFVCGKAHTTIFHENKTCLSTPVRRTK